MQSEYYFRQLDQDWERTHAKEAEEQDEEKSFELPHITVASHSDLLRIREHLIRRLEKRLTKHVYNN